jgi:hypothetical protein
MWLKYLSNAEEDTAALSTGDESAAATGDDDESAAAKLENDLLLGSIDADLDAAVVSSDADLAYAEPEGKSAAKVMSSRKKVSSDDDEEAEVASVDPSLSLRNKIAAAGGATKRRGTASVVDEQAAADADVANDVDDDDDLAAVDSRFLKPAVRFSSKQKDDSVDEAPAADAGVEDAAASSEDIGELSDVERDLVGGTLESTPTAKKKAASQQRR